MKSIAQKIRSIAITGPLISLGLTACSTPPSTSSSAGSGNITQSGGRSQNGAPQSPQTATQPSGPVAPITTPTQTTNPFDAWCATAGQTNVIKGDLANEYAQLCSGGKATTLFSQTLLSNAYAGSGAPSLMQITPTGSSGQLTSAFFGSAVRLPDTASDYFKGPALMSGNVASQTKILQAQNATVQTMDISQDQVSDSGWQRGWTIHSLATASAVITQVHLETVQQHDQYLLQDGELYMTAEITKQGVQTIQKRNQLTALIQSGNTAYLININTIQVNNLGFPSVAVDEINTILSSLVKSQFDIASGN